MSGIVHFLNRFCTLIVDLVCMPTRRLASGWTLAWIALITSLMILWVFRRSSDQAGIRTIKTRIRGNLIGLRLYQSEMPAFLRLQATIGADLVRYLGRCLRPLLVLIVPLMLIFIQLELRLDVGPLQPGEATVVTALVAGTDDVTLPAAVEAPAGVVVETPPVKIASRKELAWRVRAQQAGVFRLQIHLGDDVQDKLLVAGTKGEKISPRRTGTGAMDLLFHPGEPPLPPNAALRAIEVHYAPTRIALFGIRARWWVWFLILTLVFCLLLRRPLGVEF